MSDGTFTLQNEVFSGPLEALLNLIEARKLSISDVSLSQVCDEYVAYVERLPALPIDETSQFVLIASTLLLIKSRTLLPTLEISDEDEENIEELQGRLAVYAAVRTLSRGLRKRWGVQALILQKRALARPVVFAPGEVSPQLLGNALRMLAHTLPTLVSRPEVHIAPVRALEEVIGEVRERITRSLRARFSDITRDARDKHDVIVYFLAVLELVRGGSASATQDRLFADITIETESLGTGVPRYG